MPSSPARLEAAIADRAGAAGVIAGPPGSGKSAVIDGLERRARARGWLTWRASGAAAGRPLPYTVIRTLFDPAPAALDAQRTIAENADAIDRHCTSIAGHAPIALFVDDAQWADRASLEVLARLAERSRELPVLVVLATLPHTGHDVGAIVRVDRIHLSAPRMRDDATAAWSGVQTGSLTADVCAALARDALRHDPSSLIALRTLILTDHVTEARDGLARLHADRDAAVSLLTAELALRVGRRADAEREALRALTLGADVQDVLIGALISRGALGEARDRLGTRDATPALLLAEGRFEAAAAAAREDGRRRTAQGQTNPAIAGWRTTLGLALAHAGHFKEATAVADDDIALARAFGAPTALAAALYARCVAEQDLQERAALAADVLATDTPATLIHAGARIELGIAQLRLGEAQDAVEAFEAAAAAAHKAGALPLAVRARAALALSEGSLGLRFKTASPA